MNIAQPPTAKSGNMNSLKIQNATKGHVEYTLNGKPCSAQVAAENLHVKARINGPHTESKWAQHLLGTAETAGERKRRLTLARQRQYEIELAKPKPATKQKRPMSKLAAAMAIGTMLGAGLLR
jgi:hypothetical protein